MDLGITGKTALVAAASKGLGRAIAEGLAREGARVAICARNREALEQAAAEISAAAGNRDVLPVPADVAGADDCRRLMETVAARWGGVDMLVTNGGGPKPGTFEQLDESAWQAAVESTLMNVVRMIRLALPHMKARKWGRIVNIASTSVKQPIHGLLLSNSIRAAVAGLAKTLSFELASHGILVNTLCPGSYDTDRIRELASSRAQRNGTSLDAEMKLICDAIPLGRLGRPSELADVAVFLCSERAGYLTGTTIAVDGGMCRGAL